MKKITLLLAISFVAIIAFGQKSKVSSAANYMENLDLKKALEEINIAIDSTNPKTESSINWPRTWQVRGQIYMKAFKAGTKDIGKEPLFTAFDSFMKAIALDEKGQYTKPLGIDLMFLNNDLINYGANCYSEAQKDESKYAVSYECFVKSLEIQENPVFQKKNNGAAEIDTLCVYNAGLTALKSEKFDNAITYLNRSISMDYNAPYCYRFLFQAYQAKGDTLSGLNKLKEGFEKYPNDDNLRVEMINFYLTKGRSMEALDLLDKALEGNKENASFWFAKGFTYERLKDEANAIKCYQTAIKCDSMYRDPYYNVGALYYNKGVELINQANAVPPSEEKKFNDLMDKAKEQFALALPNIEKANELSPGEKQILETLKTLYYRLQINDKYKAILDEISKIPAK